MLSNFLGVCLGQEHTRIDVRELIASRDMAGHNDAHNEYFKQYSDWRTLARQPFALLLETGPTLARLSATLQAADLRPDVHVLDYGCGNGWLSRSLGYMGCRVTGVDVAQSAIDMAQQSISADPLSQPGQVDFRVIDGITLPFQDASIDRIICFSSFHHVADQRATLAEFFRVLKPEGIAVFSEPSDGHSESDDAQYEMRTFGVIETEVRVEEMKEWGSQIGFEDPRMFFFATTPISLNFARFETARSKGLVQTVGNAPFDDMLVLRCFSMLKPGPFVPDSRSADGLDGLLSIEMLEKSGSKIHWRATYRNNGTRRWLPLSSFEPAGAVSIGYESRTEAGRIRLGSERIEAGQHGALDFTTPALQGKVTFQFVSEHVAWFGNPVRLVIE